MNWPWNLRPKPCNIFNLQFFFLSVSIHLIQFRLQNHWNTWASRIDDENTHRNMKKKSAHTFVLHQSQLLANIVGCLILPGSCCCTQTPHIFTGSIESKDIRTVAVHGVPPKHWRISEQWSIPVCTDVCALTHRAPVALTIHPFIRQWIRCA